MTREQFEKQHNVLLIPKSESYLMRFIGFFSKRFMLFFWTTYRLPFQSKVRITYPDGIFDPMQHTNVLDHELVHARDFAHWWGPYFMALVVVPGGIWIVERRAYLVDIKDGRHTAGSAADVLWFDYGIRRYLGWPTRAAMELWLTLELARDDVAEPNG